MRRISVAALHSVLLSAALFSQVSGPQWVDPQILEGELQWFSLAETPQEIALLLGAPRFTAPFDDFVSWQFQIGVEDNHEFSHQVVFRKDGQLVSITRNYEVERTVDEWFPADASEAHSYQDADKHAFSIRVRRLSKGRLLLAMGVSEPGQKTGQIMLIKESELQHIYPWLSEQLEQNAAAEDATGRSSDR